MSFDKYGDTDRQREQPNSQVSLAHVIRFQVYVPELVTVHAVPVTSVHVGHVLSL